MSEMDIRPSGDRFTVTIVAEWVDVEGDAGLSLRADVIGAMPSTEIRKAVADACVDAVYRTIALAKGWKVEGISGHTRARN
jgi:hypothetical protein